MEFLLDESGAFYFLEMNTRLQVEHPVTEMITGIDLVELQVRAARGEPLGIAQEDVRIEGHAIEVRLYAEDPARDFAPSVGRLRRWHQPGNCVRIDAGLAAGQQITPYYDAMVAKLISHGATREEARAKLVMALQENGVFGFTTNQGFLLSLLDMPDFIAGQVTTAFIGNTFGEEGYIAPAPGPELWAFAAVTLFETIQAKMARQSVFCSAELRNWSSCAQFPTRFDLGFGSLNETLSVVPLSATAYRVMIAGEEHEVSHGPNGSLRIDGLDWPVLSDSEELERTFLEKHFCNTDGADKAEPHPYTYFNTFSCRKSTKGCDDTRENESHHNESSEHASHSFASIFLYCFFVETVHFSPALSEDTICIPDSTNNHGNCRGDNNSEEVHKSNSRIDKRPL